MNRVKRNKSTVFDIYALFIYATLIVDLYRKFSANLVGLPLSANMFRNLVYVALFGALLLSEKRVQQYFKLIAIGIGFSVLVVISLLVNWERSAASLYVDVMFMFISRLLPAYYIGKMIVRDEEKMRTAINKYQWISVMYILLILAYPETSENSYITISNNLLIPTMVAIFCGQKGVKGLLLRGIGVAGVAVILVYGGRTSMVSVLVAVVLILLVWLKENRSVGKVIGFAILATVCVVLLVAYDSIIDLLLLNNPDSRTLRLLANGEFLWTSNRDGYYEAAFASVVNHPFKFYGLLGDRFYYADVFGNTTDNTVIVSMFSHNVPLELLLNFGVIPGGIIIGYFVVKVILAFWTLNSRKDRTAWAVYLIFLACSFTAAMVSSSWLNDYSLWLSMGMTLTLGRQRFKEREVQYETS